MTTRTISSTNIAALQAARSIIADAAGHPAQKAAIEAIDRLGEATPQPTSLIDFIEMAWPAVFPDKPFGRTPFLEHICRAAERHAAGIDANTVSDPVSWYADGSGPIRQEFTWEADPWVGGVLSSKDSRLAVGITRNGNSNTAIAFPIDPPAGKRREVTRLDVRVTYVDRDAPQSVATPDTLPLVSLKPGPRVAVEPPSTTNSADTMPPCDYKAVDQHSSYERVASVNVSVYPGGCTELIYRHRNSSELWATRVLHDDDSSWSNGQWYRVEAKQRTITEYVRLR